MEDVYLCLDNASFDVGRATTRVPKLKLKHVAKTNAPPRPVGRPPRLVPVPVPEVGQPQPLWLQDMHAMADTLLTLEKQVEISFIKFECAEALEREESTRNKIRPPHLFPHRPHENDKLFSMSSVTERRLTILDSVVRSVTKKRKTNVAMSSFSNWVAFATGACVFATCVYVCVISHDSLALGCRSSARRCESRADVRRV
jgi:hypothetical protein